MNLSAGEEEEADDMPTCSFCGANFTVNVKHKKFLVGTSFCELDCLRRWVENQPVVPHREQIFDKIHSYTGLKLPVPQDYYSILLHKSFRSEYEAFFAELAVFGWGWGDLQYESCYFKNGTRVYLPDFFQPKTTVWLEVKGAWKSGGKKKVLSAMEHVGENRLILVSPIYYDEIRKEALALRRKLQCTG